MIFANSADTKVSVNDKTVDYVSQIIRSEFDTDGCHKLSPEKYTPVLVAAHYGHKAFIEYIIENEKDGLELLTETTKDKRKMNILHICAMRSGSAEDSNDRDNEDEEKQHSKGQDNTNKIRSGATR